MRVPTISEFATYLEEAATTLTQALDALADAGTDTETKAWARLETAEQRLRALSDMATAALKEHTKQ